MNLFIYILVLFTFHGTLLADKPCAQKPIPNQSVVCVCDASYCDDITREPPEKDSYVAYTTSRSGQRFNKTRGAWSQNGTCEESKCSISLELKPRITYQKVEGFGGAVTDAAGINWKALPQAAQDYLINSYFSESGLEYNMLRVPIGGCDFSTHAYAYNELPVNDTKLTNYTLAPEDFMYKIPMIKEIMKTAKTDVHIVATTWSPPTWMKNPQVYGGFNRLLPRYYQTYADYYLKFLQKYNETGIPIWGITTTNEPINGDLNLVSFNSLGWDARDMAKWIINNLGPTIRNSEFKDIKIITGDDQRLIIPYWYNVMLLPFPKVLDYIDGIGVHFYTDKFVPPSILEPITRFHPDKFILATEACEGSFPWQAEKVLLGSWQRAKSYIKDILEDLNYNLIGWIDWNLCLDMQGGPNWVENFVDSPIIVDKEKQQFYKQPMFYAMGHFSKFIPRGSVRIKVVENKPFLTSYLTNVAFITPKNTTVVVIYNDGGNKTIELKRGNKKTSLFLEGHSITTVELPNE